MIDKLLTFARSIPGILSLGTILILAYSNIQSGCNNQALEDQNVELTNKLADASKLTEVLKESNFVLSEKYARKEKDFDEVLKQKKQIQQYAKSQDGRMLALIETNNKLRLENQQISGRLSQDTSGNEVAVFDTITTQYSLSAAAQLHPFPTLDIHYLIVPDSTYVGILETGEGFLKGFVGHTNPLIQDEGATFRILLDAATQEPFFSIKWWHGALVLAGIAIGAIL